MAGCAIARRFKISLTAVVSARSDFKNFNRAGVAKNKSRTSTRVPTRLPPVTAETFPPLTHAWALSSPAAAGQFKMGDRTNAGQSLAAKTEAGD